MTQSRGRGDDYSCPQTHSCPVTVTVGLKLQNTSTHPHVPLTHTHSSILVFAGTVQGNHKEGILCPENAINAYELKECRLKLSGYVTEFCSLKNSMRSCHKWAVKLARVSRLTWKSALHLKMILGLGL